MSVSKRVPVGQEKAGPEEGLATSRLPALQPSTFREGVKVNEKWDGVNKNLESS